MLATLLRYPVRLIIGACVLLFVSYEICVNFFAYTGDSYVASDIVVVSSQIEGPVERLAVQNNQPVEAGSLLFTIEATPYKLAVDQAEAALAQARENVDLARDELASAKANVTSTQAVETNARAELTRISTLNKEGFSTEASLDVATRDLATASAGVLVAQAALQVASQRISVGLSNVAAAEAALATARYNLSKTTVPAPEAGRIAPFTTRAGDYLRPGTEVLAIVTERRKRVVANMAERHLNNIKLGQRVWVTLGSQPWTIHRGHVTGVAAGVSRSQTSPQILPYVAPTTDWVRLPRRFPVEITLDDWPPDLPHYVGADARTLIWF